MQNNINNMSNSAYDFSSPLEKICRVCGDKASAFNFNGLSCESCKSFFRRNACRESELECTKFGACEMTIKTRKFCAKCRLARCLEIGMRKDYIYKRKQPQITSEEQEINYIKAELMSSFNPFSTSPTSSFVCSGVVESQFPPLSGYEKQKIEEVVSYYKVLKEENTFKVVSEPPEREIMISLCEDYGKFMVRMIKNIPTFTKYNIDDRIVLIRNCLSIICDMRFTFYFDVETNTGLVQNILDPSYCYRVSLNMWGDLISEELLEIWREKLLQNKTVMMSDPVVRDLLITMALFREHERISCPDTLRYDYLHYYYLLRRYLQVKLKNRERFEKHMIMFHRVLGEFPKMQEQSRQFYEIISPHYSVQLMAEIYEN